MGEADLSGAQSVARLRWPAACEGAGDFGVEEVGVANPQAAGKFAAGDACDAQLGDLLESVLACETPASGVAQRLLEGADLVALSRANPEMLVSEHGLQDSAARRLVAAFELGRRLARATLPARPRIDNAAAVFRTLAVEVRGLERETFYVLLLDGKHQLKRRELVSIGSLTSSLVHPREVFRAAVGCGAAAVVCAHNHPSGDPEPSAEDLDVTRRLAQAGRLLGISLLDHVILGDSRYVSLRERLAW